MSNSVWMEMLYTGDMIYQPENYVKYPSIEAAVDAFEHSDCHGAVITLEEPIAGENENSWAVYDNGIWNTLDGEFDGKGLIAHCHEVVDERD